MSSEHPDPIIAGVLHVFDEYGATGPIGVIPARGMVDRGLAEVLSDHGGSVVIVRLTAAGRAVARAVEAVEAEAAEEVRTAWW